MAELTTQGYDMIIERIRDMHIETPTILTAVGLQIWIQAYVQCQNEVIELIEDLKGANMYGR